MPFAVLQQCSDVLHQEELTCKHIHDASVIEISLLIGASPTSVHRFIEYTSTRLRIPGPLKSCAPRDISARGAGEVELRVMQDSLRDVYR